MLVKCILSQPQSIAKLNWVKFQKSYYFFIFSFSFLEGFHIIKWRELSQDSLDLAEKQVSRQITYEPHSAQKNNAIEAPALASGSVSISSNQSRRVTREDIEVVSHLIWCSFAVVWLNYFIEWDFTEIYHASALFVLITCVGPQLNWKVLAVVYEQRWGHKHPFVSCKNWTWLYHLG